MITQTATVFVHGASERTLPGSWHPWPPELPGGVQAKCLPWTVLFVALSLLRGGVARTDRTGRWRGGGASPKVCKVASLGCGIFFPLPLSFLKWRRPFLGEVKGVLEGFECDYQGFYMSLSLPLKFFLFLLLLF